MERGRTGSWFAIVSIQALLCVLFYLTVGIHMYLLLWILPILTVSRFLMGVRSIGEHAEHSEIDDPEQRFLNSIYCNAVEQFFFSPLSFNFHAEHHLFPNIPTWRLPEISARLRQLPYFREHVHTRQSFITYRPR